MRGLIPFYIALKDLLVLLKDKKALLTLLATPLVLILVLGSAFGSFWSEKAAPSPVLYCNDDQGQWGAFLFEEVFALPALKEKFTLEETRDLESARELVRSGKAAALIHIPAGFSAALLEGGEARISVWGDPGSSVRAQVVRAVVERYTLELSSRRVVYQTLGELGLGGEEFYPRAERLLEALQLEPRIEDGLQRTAAGGMEPEAMDYYAAAMGVMYLLMTTTTMAGKFVQERQDRTLARMLQAPATPRQIILGKFMGVFLTGALQFAVIILASAVIFQVSWGSLPGVALLAAASVCGAAGIGMLVAALARTPSTADAAGLFVTLTMSALGGSMYPLFVMPPLMQAASKVTLNSWALQGFMKLMFAGGNLQSVALEAAVLAVAGLVLCLAASYCLRGEAG